MPASIAHFITFIETYHALKSENVKIFEVEPVKKNELYSKGVLGKSDKGISQYGFLGSIFPDLPYYHKDDKTKYAADLFHYNKAGTFAIKLIDYAKGKDKGSPSANRLMAFILGFISHVSCDVVCHPYINTIAGGYWIQLLPKVGESAVGTKASMHMMTETHQDAWLANKYFGLRDLSSTGAFKSWSDFIDDIGLGMVAPITKETVELFGDIRKCFEEVYGKKLDEEPLEDAGDRFFEALDLGYDSASFPIPDKPSMNLVDYDNRAHDYYDYLKRAFTLSQELCKKALTYYNGGDKEKDDLKNSLKDWNLDTGYCIKISNISSGDKIDSIHIRFEHSWCHTYGLYKE